jgi:hypothetical protein
MYMHEHALLYHMYRHATYIDTYVLSYMVMFNSFSFGPNYFLERMKFTERTNMTIVLYFGRLGLDEAAWTKVKFRLSLDLNKCRVNTYTYIACIRWDHYR